MGIENGHALSLLVSSPANVLRRYTRLTLIVSGNSWDGVHLYKTDNSHMAVSIDAVCAYRLSIAHLSL
jgi:hypothetical protein